MMGHREPLRGGDEVDTFSRWRRLLKKRAGKFKRVKVRFNRRVRRLFKKETFNDVEQ